MTFDEALDFFDFSYETYEDGYGLIDNQRVNLGNIEDERFLNPLDMIERLYYGIYGDDYIFFECDDNEKYVEENKDNKESYIYYIYHTDEIENVPPNIKEI